ncbi:hypothetical protein PENSPDRAFT_574408 [Peniophora sp. CONT]|nr:hypothetical protein PENSPDRAFT_574408 [Peniophora sp. CONT]
MPRTLEGSCHCGVVKFSILSSAAVPYQNCFCSICRKIGGPGGIVDLDGYAETLEVQGKENISIYHAVLANRGEPDEQRASSERSFCKLCGSMLWLFFPDRPKRLYPFASAIDTPLASAEEMTILMVESKPDWVRLPEGPKSSESYPAESLENWHKRHSKWIE